MLLNWPMKILMGEFFLPAASWLGPYLFSLSAASVELNPALLLFCLLSASCASSACHDCSELKEITLFQQFFV
jgi:hypothetical protein